MVTCELDGVSFHLERERDLSWVSRFGRVFAAIDQTGSGCLCLGLEDVTGVRRFLKIAGAGTTEAEVSPSEAIDFLKAGVCANRALAHPALVRLIDAFPQDDLYVAVYEWAAGECLFDHWNFEAYKADTSLVSPRERFRGLPVAKRLAVCDVLFEFLEHVAARGWVAVDFYDSSILYDFSCDTVRLCDIDLFRCAPVVNDAGKAWFGSPRLKAPEENVLGAPIDERTNEFTLGALMFDFLSDVTNVPQRREVGHFLPNDRLQFELGDAAYETLLRATSIRREERYSSITEFERAWHKVNS